MIERIPTPPTDLGKLLLANPYLYRVHKILSANMPSFMKLELGVALVDQKPPYNLNFWMITAVNAVDYAVRPKPPACIEGGGLVCYHEKHERLESIGQDIPHSDGLEYFDPPIRFTLLELEHTYIIAERFEIRPLK